MANSNSIKVYLPDEYLPLHEHTKVVGSKTSSKKYWCETTFDTNQWDLKIDGNTLELSRKPTGPDVLDESDPGRNYVDQG